MVDMSFGADRNSPAERHLNLREKASTYLEIVMGIDDLPEDLFLINAVTRRYFFETYPACIIPITHKTIYSFITNVDEHDEVGQHWNGWFVRESKFLFFDCFGREYDDEILPLHYQKIFEQYDSVE